VARKKAKKALKKSRKGTKKRTARSLKKAEKPKKTPVRPKKIVKPTPKKREISLVERLQHLLTETSVVVYASKPAGDYGATFISDNVEKLCGYSYKSFLTKPSFWIDHVHPDDRERVLKEVPQVFEHGYYAYEYRFKHKSGKYIWMRDEMKLVCDDKGKPVEIVGYWIDISKRKKTEDALRVSTERLQRFMDSATEGFVLFDSKLNIIDVNRHLLEEFNLTKQEVVGMNFLDLSEGAYESGRYEQYLEVLETGKPIFFDDLVTPPHYGSRDVTARVFKVGDCLGMIVREVTEEKKSERKLRESEERFRSLFEAINAGVIFQDSDGNVVNANKQACEILDLDEDELTGKNLLELCSQAVDAQGNYVEDDKHPLTMTLQTGVPVRNRIVGIPSDDPGGRRWLLVNTEPIMDPYTSAVDEVLCTFVDITEQKNIEDALEESEERYRHIFEHCPIGIGISGVDGKVITANKAMLGIMGYSLDEVRRINIADTYVSVDDRRRLLQALNQYGRVTNYRVRLKRKDGTPYDAILNISRINIGGKDYYHTMCQKVTSKKTK